MSKTNLKYELNNETPSERKKYIRGMFDSIVPTYDLLNRMLSMGIDTTWRNYLIKLTGGVKDKKVLDMCCGTGDLSKLFIKNKADTVSLDFSIPMIIKGKDQGWLGENSIGADAAVLPFKADVFDFSSISFGIRNIPDLDNFMVETSRVMKKGGRLYVLELTRPSNPLVRFFYNLYLGVILPFVGGIVSGKREAYKYLSKTIETFVDPEELKRMFLEKGYSEVNLYKKTFGIATIIECVK